jgi:hypothetical protein
VREIRLHGSEGGAAETNRSFLPLSKEDESAAALAGRILDESIAAVEDRAIQIRRTDRTILSASS